MYCALSFLRALQVASSRAASQQMSISKAIVPQAQADVDDVDEEECCRICWGPATDAEPLVVPCKCKGSLRHAHANCARLWVEQCNRLKCEVIAQHADGAQAALPCQSSLCLQRLLPFLSPHSTAALSSSALPSASILKPPLTDSGFAKLYPVCPVPANLVRVPRAGPPISAHFLWPQAYSNALQASPFASSCHTLHVCLCSFTVV